MVQSQVVAIKREAFRSLSTMVGKLTYQPIGIMVFVFANCPGDCGLIVGSVIPKMQKMVLDAFLFNSQLYKVQIMYMHEFNYIYIIQKHLFMYAYKCVFMMASIYIYIYIYIYRERERGREREREREQNE